MYDEGYFKYGILTGQSAYSNYRWLPERTYKEIRALINALDIEPKTTVLDFGCAMGYWVKALRHYNILAFGVDISSYCLENSDIEVQEYLSDEINDNYDIIVSRNTLEHLTEEELIETLKDFGERTNKVFFTVPLCEENGGKYIIPVADIDITHKIRWTKQKWVETCVKCGWNKITFRENIQGIHDKWQNFNKGTGFFLLEK